MRKKKLFSGYFASPLRYPGGKGRLGPWLASVIHANQLGGGLYVEPYAGGAGAALYLLLQDHVERIVINDDDPLIYSFWKSVVDEADALVDLIRSTPPTMKTRSRLLTVAANPEDHSTLQLGFAAFFLNRTSRSGILTGGVIGGKDQKGAYKMDARYTRKTLIARIRAIAARRQHIKVLCKDALKMLAEDIDESIPKTVIYLDPPYFSKGSLLYENHYEPTDHKTISRFVSTIKHPTLVTYDNCPEIRALYQNMKSVQFSLRYSTHMLRPVASEILIYRNLEIPTPPVLTRGAYLPSTGRSRKQAA